MKMMLMPSLEELKMKKVNYKQIAGYVMALRKTVSCEWEREFKVPSIIAAVKNDDVDYAHDLRNRFSKNLKEEKKRSKARFEGIRDSVKKGDMEQVERIENEFD